MVLFDFDQGLGQEGNRGKAYRSQSLQGSRDTCVRQPGLRPPQEQNPGRFRLDMAANRSTWGVPQRQGWIW